MKPDMEGVDSVTGVELALSLRSKGEPTCVIDCRFPEEYAVGHIRGAVNIWHPGVAETFFFKLQEESGPKFATTRVVLYCEYSTNRSVKMFRYIRRLDRERNVQTYPHLDVPNMHVLVGGYRSFYESQGDLCTGGYARMRSPSCPSSARLNSKLRKSWREISKQRDPCPMISRPNAHKTKRRLAFGSCQSPQQWPVRPGSNAVEGDAIELDDAPVSSAPHPRQEPVRLLIERGTGSCKLPGRGATSYVI